MLQTGDLLVQLPAAGTNAQLGQDNVQRTVSQVSLQCLCGWRIMCTNEAGKLNLSREFTSKVMKHQLLNASAT